MTDVFTASNGLTIEPLVDGTLRIRDTDRKAGDAYAAPKHALALEEFFAAKESAHRHTPYPTLAASITVEDLIDPLPKPSGVLLSLDFLLNGDKYGIRMPALEQNVTIEQVERIADEAAEIVRSAFRMQAARKGIV